MADVGRTPGPLEGEKARPRKAAARKEAMFLGVSAATLAEAMDAECKLLIELAETLRKQREGVARDDVLAVDDSVGAARRIIRTLGEARTRRRTLVGILVAAEDVPLDDLDVALGARMTRQLTTARRRLQDEARIVAREIEINLRVLSGAVAQADGFMQALSGRRPDHHLADEMMQTLLDMKR